MKFLLTKASSDFWYDFIEEDSIESLLGRFSSCGDLVHSLIIKENFFYQESISHIMNSLELSASLNSLEQALEISKCKYEIQIYDDYIE